MIKEIPQKIDFVITLRGNNPLVLNLLLAVDNKQNATK